jgi:hypothetical protein
VAPKKKAKKKVSKRKAKPRAQKKKRVIGVIAVEIRMRQLPFRFSKTAKKGKK